MTSTTVYEVNKVTVIKDQNPMFPRYDMCYVTCASCPDFHRESSTESGAIKQADAHNIHCHSPGCCREM